MMTHLLISFPCTIRSGLLHGMCLCICSCYLIFFLHFCKFYTILCFPFLTKFILELIYRSCKYKWHDRYLLPPFHVQNVFIFVHFSEKIPKQYVCDPHHGPAPGVHYISTGTPGKSRTREGIYFGKLLEIDTSRQLLYGSTRNLIMKMKNYHRFYMF